MSAKNGLAVSFRTRGRLVGCCAAMVLAIFAVFASSAGAAAPIKENYLALGDSVAFGYSQQLFNENEKAGEPASAFEHGYAHYYWVHLKPALEGVGQVNNGCPGETTDSLIGNGALAGAFGIPGETPCAYHTLAGHPLHNEYGGVSQLENTIGTIAGLSLAGKPVTHVSLNIGANDELHAIGKCEAEVKAEFEATGESKYNPEEPEGSGKHPGSAESAVKNCIVASVPGLFKHIIENTGRILTAIREGSKFGGVNYGGPIIILTGYDPYGNLCGPPTTFTAPVPEATCRAIFKMKEGQKELLEGSRNLQALLTQEEKKALAPFGVCFADPLPRFNPANKNEPTTLQKFTNMVNFTEFEGKKNGPDIHPTLTGYKVLTSVMVKACG